MAFYSEELIEEIRSQNEIVNLISGYLPLKKKGNSYFGLCPFHHEKSPSFCVSIDKQMYYCFGCGAAGNVITFVMQIENYNFPEAIKFLAERINYNLPEFDSKQTKKKLEYKNKLLKIMLEAGRFFYKNLIKSNLCLEYLSKRNVKKETIKKFGLGYDDGNLNKYLIGLGYKENDIIDCGLAYKDKSNKLKDKFPGRITFPIIDIYGKLIAFGGRVINGYFQPKYLNSPETVLFNKSSGLYNINLACKSGKKELILVEGYMDAISLYQAGFKNVCAVLGTAFSSKQAKLIKSHFENVILLFDNDDAGQKAIIRAIDTMQTIDLEPKVLLIENAKDPDEYIKIFGSNSFKNLLENNSIGTVEFKIKCLKKKYNLENMSDKVKFTKEAAQIIFDLRDKIKQEIYIREIADMLHISGEALREEIDNKMSKETEPVPELKKFELKNKMSSGSYSLGKNIDRAKSDLINILIKEPKFCFRVKKYLKPEEMGKDIFARLLELVYIISQTDCIINAATLVNYFETQVEQVAVAKILSKDFFYDDLNKALNDIIKIIKKEYLREKIFLANDNENVKFLLNEMKLIDRIVI